ncbi:MAG: hypothetical protein IH614_09810, partial [Desulfuromonadales bacterium]|nr:hypothetical protein [Desulfuromonadales bacterium]
MTASGDEFWLIVQPTAAADERLTTVVPELARLGLDPFAARQRLVGHGPALLATGERTLLEKGADLLRAHRFVHWLLIPTPPRWAPERILALRPTPGAIHFTCRHGEVVFPRDSPILAVLADLSGKMPERQMQRLVAQNAYRGAVSPATEEELYLEVVRGEPVLDLYLLSLAGRPQHGVRIFPGRFDPQGLGELATYSATGNLEALLALVREQAGSFSLHPEFGLASLPGCRPKPSKGGEQRRQSLAALTRFGWLLTDLRQAEARAETAGDQRPQTVTTAATALLHPLTTGLGTTPILPLLATAAAGSGAAWPVAAATAGNAGEPAAAPPIGLPPPPLAAEGDGNGGGFRPLAWFTG